MDSNFPWLNYSKSKDGTFCKACALFAPSEVNRQNLGILVSSPFCNWTYASSAFQRHEKKAYHQDSMVKMDSFKSSLTSPSSTVGNMIDKNREALVKTNYEVVKSLFECVLFCGRQGLAFLGHRDAATHENSSKGNFLELVKFRSQTDPILANHLKNAPKNATYTSKTIQNELIQVVGDSLRDDIISEIKESKYYSILADEVTDLSNQEQLSFVIRFVDKCNLIREEFLDFITVDRITGEKIASSILSRLETWDIPIANCRGQGYDGASNMSSVINGGS